MHYHYFPTNFLILLSVLSLTINSVHSIGCYKCTTTGNDTSCGDPFNPGLSTPESLYENDCRSGIEGRTGYFPARYCLKVSGYHADTGEQLVIRTCTVNKLLDSDSFIMSFTLKLDGANDIHVVSGHIASCKDDGCNHGNRRQSTTLSCLMGLVVISVLMNWICL